MYGSHASRITSTIHTLGRTCNIRTRSETGTDGFGNPTDSWSDSNSDILAVRTYPQRNTEDQSAVGDLHTDNALFVMPKEGRPENGARIEYPEDAETADNATNTTLYELSSATIYDTHVEMYGQQVVNE